MPTSARLTTNAATHPLVAPRKGCKSPKALFRNAQRNEKRLGVRIAVANREGDVGRERALMHHYVHSRSAAIIASVDENNKKPRRYRRLLDGCIEAADKSAPCTANDEVIRVHEKPKRDPRKKRVYCSFGPYSRISQRVCKNALSKVFNPSPYQYAEGNGGVTAAVMAVKTALETGEVRFAAQLDVQNHFGSISKEWLSGRERVLRLPERAIQQSMLIGEERRLIEGHTRTWPYRDYDDQLMAVTSTSRARQGVPQGAISS